MEGDTKQNVSHWWRSIIAGKEVLKKGLGWLVGNGDSINIWSDPWLSTSKISTPVGPTTAENLHLKVSDLLNPNSNEWNL